MSIIERDYEFYCGEVERLYDQLRRCSPSEEDAVRAKLLLALRVRDSLRDYGLVLGYVLKG